MARSRPLRTGVLVRILSLEILTPWSSKPWRRPLNPWPTTSLQLRGTGPQNLSFQENFLKLQETSLLKIEPYLSEFTLSWKLTVFVETLGRFWFFLPKLRFSETSFEPGSWWFFQNQTYNSPKTSSENFLILSFCSKIRGLCVVFWPPTRDQKSTKNHDFWMIFQGRCFGPDKGKSVQGKRIGFSPRFQLAYARTFLRVFFKNRKDCDFWFSGPQSGIRQN